MAVAKGMAAAAATALGCGDEFIFVSSTGVIGVPLSLDKVRAGVTAAAAVLSIEGGGEATRAIMTTDPFPKSCAAVIDTPRGRVTVGGIAKGSGMIEPRMATMLGFLTTDAKVAPGVLQTALRQVCDETFNAITVDGECSTNDCVLLLASGASGVEITDPADPALVEPLRTVAGHLAREIVRGGEGATKLVAVRVTGAASLEDARLAARTICNSPLVKTAIHGADPNWGRLIAAAGRSGAHFVLDHASVRIGDIDLFVNGVPFDERAESAATVLQQKQMVITVNLGTGGDYEATMWTCDFSAEYVRINSEYRT
jgi:glutamate N-acetyltransferase/amino-acid N-acetyltransferase